MCLSQCWILLAACGVDPRAPDSDAGRPFQSCETLEPTCGGGESCCESLIVPGGTFLRSYDGYLSLDPSYPASVSTFALDKYEVTVGRFRAFVEAGRGTQARPPAPGSGARMLDGVMYGWEAVWTSDLVADTSALVSGRRGEGQPLPEYHTWREDGAQDNRPINGVTWFEAMAFCIWDGGYLPTETEWNYAAAGGDEQRVFPWSQPPASPDIDATRASYQDTDGCWGDGQPGCDPGDILPVGSRPAGNGRWGHSDLAGNLGEWVLDYSGSHEIPCADCARLDPEEFRLRMVRGGSFGSPTPMDVRATMGRASSPGPGGPDIGFRCARPSVQLE